MGPETGAGLCLSRLKKLASMMTEAGIALYLPIIIKKMKFYYIYVLRGKNDYLYIGYSEDLRDRIQSHNSGQVRSTKPYGPLELIHYEAYRNKQDAKRREKYLKTNRGRTTLITMLKEFFTE